MPSAAKFVGGGGVSFDHEAACDMERQREIMATAAYQAGDPRPSPSAVPRLRALRIPSLVISGDHDFIPGEIAVPIAQALPNAHLVTLKDCGHFAYLECAADVRTALEDFLRRGVGAGR